MTVRARRGRRAPSRRRPAARRRPRIRFRRCAAAEGVDLDRGRPDRVRRRRRAGAAESGFREGRRSPGRGRFRRLDRRASASSRLGRSLETANLRDATSAEAAAARMADAAAGAASRRLGGGPRLGPEPLDGSRRSRTPRTLDRGGARPAGGGAPRGRPRAWVNTAALAAAGRQRGDAGPAGRPDPPAAGRLALGRPRRQRDGALVERVCRRRPRPTSGALARPPAAAACAGAGLTEVQDASGIRTRDGIAALERLAAARGDCRSASMRRSRRSRSRSSAWFARGPRVGARRRLSDRARDQDLRRRRARQPRRRSPRRTTATNPGRGVSSSRRPNGSPRSRSRRARHGWQLWIHAIGDRGNRAALDAYARARREGRPDAPRRRATGRASSTPRSSRPTTSPASAGSGSIASIQPTHATSDMAWADDRLGPGAHRGCVRLAPAQARRASGWPGAATPRSSRRGPSSGSTRPSPAQDLAGRPPGGWEPGAAADARRRPSPSSPRTRRTPPSRRARAAASPRDRSRLTSSAAIR